MGALMSLELGLLVSAVLLLLVVLYRVWPPTSAEPALAALQATLGQQAALLGALDGAVKAELARHGADLSREISGFTVEQTKALNAALDVQRRALAAQDDVIQALAPTLTAQVAKDATLAAEHAAALRRDLATGLGEFARLIETLKTLAAETSRLQSETQAHQAKTLVAALGEGQLKLGEALAQQMTQARDLIDVKALEARTQLDSKLTEMRTANEAKLAEIQKSVNEQLQSAVEKQMNESFTRVIDQFTAIQQMMGNVQAVASQVGDLKRLFGNVKARGGWGESQVRALLEDILPTGTWDSNVRLREDSLDVVEFTVTMPSQGSQKSVMAVDAKFPTEDYDRLLLAADAADSDGEKAARAALERRIRGEASKIAAKYICPPRTVEFAVMYLPNDGLYAEVARIPGLTDEIGRLHRVFVLGPALLPAMLRTIQLGHVTLALSENAEGVRDLLSATKAEMKKMDDVLTKVLKNVGTVTTTVSEAQRRTRVINRKLKSVEVMTAPAAEALLELDAEDSLDAEDPA